MPEPDKHLLTPRQAAKLVSAAHRVRDNPDRGPIHFMQYDPGVYFFFFWYVLETGMAKSVKLTLEGAGPDTVVADAEWA